MEMTIIRPGQMSTIQDSGRRGFRDVGVPVGGAMDDFALRVANLLVGNEPGAAVIECALSGPEIEFGADTLVAVTGAEFEGVPGWRPITMRAGERLKLGGSKRGCYGCIAVAGGIEVPLVMGSRSTYLRAGFGGLAGRVLREGDVLTSAAGRRRAPERWSIDARILPAYSAQPTVRVLRGAQAGEFGDSFWNQAFEVSAHSDRMGVRLSGKRLERADADDLLSSAVAPGTVQVPPDGHPIVLMADAQTIGGYPQIGHVIGQDRPLIAQLRPGDRVSFVETTLAEAHRLALARERALGLLREGLAQKIH